MRMSAPSTHDFTHLPQNLCASSFESGDEREVKSPSAGLLRIQERFVEISPELGKKFGKQPALLALVGDENCSNSAKQFIIKSAGIPVAVSLHYSL